MELNRRTVIAGAAAAGIAASTLGTGTAQAASGGRKPVKELFGTLADGSKVYRWSLENGGTRLKVLSWGGVVQSLELPDRHGKYANVSLGFDNIADYVAKTPYFGALIGRYGNRIAKGQFALDGKSYQVSVNDGVNSLHGGTQGFDKHIWDVEGFTSGSDVGLHLYYTSVDGEMGYPGTLKVKVTYTLNKHGDWRIDYEATTDKATVVNLTSHVYWNLMRRGQRHDREPPAHDPRRPLHADRLGADPHGRTGQGLRHPFDFRKTKPIGRDIRAAHVQQVQAKGYDHNWALDKGITAKPEHAATLHDPHSGRTLKIATDQPGLQFYTGNFLDGTLTGTGGHTYRQGDALCLETQHFPDSPNHANFPSTVLRPGQTYKTSTIHTFGN